mmetsp:Transcript_69304/g.113452  ORF Transcript_69304/g.113452 Transcript_69304/m.113452 type:complete len:348 (+) Transcript_69304:1147-2190(+)
MASAATAVGDDGTSLLHDGFPIGIRHVSHQHLTLLELAHLIDAGEDIHLATTNALANGATLGHGLATFLQHLVLLDDSDLLLRCHRLGSRLHDVELAIVAIAGPLDVHGAAVVLLNFHRHLSQVLDLLIRGGPAVLLFLAGIHRLGAAARLVDHLHQLGPHSTRDDGVLALRQGRLEDVPLIRVHGATHHGLAQAIGRGHEDNVFEAALRVQREHHSCGASLAAHHLLAGRAELDLLVFETSVVAVGDGAIGKEGGKHQVHLLLHILVAHDVQKGLLLPREGRVRQILRRGRAAHREGELLIAARDALPLGLQFLFKVFLERSVHDLVTNRFADLHELIHILINRLV